MYLFGGIELVLLIDPHKLRKEDQIFLKILPAQSAPLAANACRFCLP